MFIFRHNAEVWEEGKSKLKEWKQYFLDEELPERDSDWKWTDLPCKWCPLKKVCKADYKNSIKSLKDSGAIEFAKSVRPEYNYDQTRKEVLDRWQKQHTHTLD